MHVRTWIQLPHNMHAYTLQHDMHVCRHGPYMHAYTYHTYGNMHAYMHAYMHDASIAYIHA